MTPNDFENFYAAWVDVCEMSAGNKTPSDRIVSRAFDMLIEYPLEYVLAAITAHGKLQRFAPTVPDIIEIINKAMGNEHLSPAEAWGRFPKEPYQSAMVTIEMFRAWDVAEELYRNKQFFAAEKAFLSTYEREVSESILAGRKPVRTLSKGTDETQLKATIKDALSRNWITREYAQSVLAELPAPVTGVVAGLIKKGQAPKSTQGFTEVAKSNISQILKMFDEADEKEELKRKQAREAEIKRRDSMIEAAMMELLPEQQIALKNANLERYGSEVLH